MNLILVALFLASFTDWTHCRPQNVQIEKQQLIKWPRNLPTSLLEKRGSIEETQRILQEIERINLAFGYTKRGIDVAAPRQTNQEYFFPRPAYHPLQHRHQNSLPKSASNEQYAVAPLHHRPSQSHNGRQVLHQRSYYVPAPFSTAMVPYYYPSPYQQSPSPVIRYNPMPFYPAPYMSYPYPNYYSLNALRPVRKELSKSPKAMGPDVVHYFPVADANNVTKIVAYKSNASSGLIPEARVNKIVEELAKSNVTATNVKIKKTTKKKSKLSAKRKNNKNKKARINKPGLKQNKESEEATEEDTEDEDTETDDEEEEEEEDGDAESGEREDEEEEEEEGEEESGSTETEGDEEEEEETSGSVEKEDEENTEDEEEEDEEIAQGPPALTNDKFLFNRKHGGSSAAIAAAAAAAVVSTQAKSRNLDTEELPVMKKTVPTFFQNITRRFIGSSKLTAEDSLKETPDTSDGDAEKGPFGGFYSPNDLKQATEGGGLVIQRLRVRQGGIAIAGPGGVATAGSGGTAIVGPNGLAITHPRGLAIAGPGARVYSVPETTNLEAIALNSTSGRTPSEGVLVARGPVVYYNI